MTLAGFLPLLLLTAVGGQSSEKVCSYQDVLNHLNLTKNNELFSMTRPVKDYRQPTQVCLEVQLYAVLDVREIDQTFIPYVWIVESWHNQHILWDPEDFCGIRTVSIPTDALWRPDLCIEEMTEKDKAPPSPHLTIHSDGLVHVQNDHVLVSTCRMHVFKFPFDVQRCNLSFKSVVHSVDEIRLVHRLSSAEDTDASMRTQYEWLFIDMTVTNKTVVMFNLKQDVLIYTISMRRRSVLYIVNFLLPILIFLCLDLASFLISDTGGEKLAFKITVMLAITVMQLILNDILPSSSDRIPLVVVYCIGIFGLMMLSLLETILVMYLMGRDSASEDSKTRRSPRRNSDSQGSSEGGGSHRSEGDRKWTVRVCDAGEPPAEPPKDETELFHAKQTGDGSLSQESQQLPAELREALKALALLLDGGGRDDAKPGYWTRKTKTINRVFFVFYVVAAALFLVCMFSVWTNQQE